MFKFVKTGLTIARKVWTEGEVVTDEEAEKNGIAAWFELTGGKKHEKQYLIRVASKNELQGAKSSVHDKKSEISIEDELVLKVRAKGMTIEEVQRLKWKDIVKNFGPVLGKRIKDYQK
jgi:ATP:corrinoid adenosyltransferase